MPQSTDDKKKSATPLEMTLFMSTRATFQDMVRHALANGLDVNRFISSCAQLHQEPSAAKDS